MSDIPEIYPNPTDARLYAATVGVYDWQMFDITPFSQSKDLGLLAASPERIAEGGPIRRVEDKRQYLLAPKPGLGETDADALRNDSGAVACLEVAKLLPAEILWKQTTRSPRFAFFSRLVIDQVAVLASSPSYTERDQADGVCLKSNRAAEAFNRSFLVMTANEYAREMSRY